MDRHSNPTSPTARSQWSLSIQSTFEEECQPVTPLSSEETGLETETAHATAPAPPAPHTHTNNNTYNLPRPKSKANLKLLKRSHAIKESTSPPPDVMLSPVSTPTIAPTSEPPASNSLAASPVPVSASSAVSTSMTASHSGRPPIKRDSSNQSTDSSWSSTLSRALNVLITTPPVSVRPEKEIGFQMKLGNSIEQQYTDQGVDIEQFIIDTLNKNAKDRIFLLRIENDLVVFTKDSRRISHRFGPMSSYQRMLVHRVAHYFGLEHNVDPIAHSVVVNKGKSTRLPENRFSDFIRDDLLLSEEPRRSILKRDSASFEDTVSFKSPDRHSLEPTRRSKSFEEREEEYEKARRRIFHEEQVRCSGDDPSVSDRPDDDTQENLRWPLLTWNTDDSTKLHPNRSPRLTKMESYEGKDSLRTNSLRSSVNKANSLQENDQSSPSSKQLTKQDSGSSVSSRVSPSSSGYKSQSQRSDATLSATPSPTLTPHLPTQLSTQSNDVSPEPEHQPTVMWAVTNMASVPPGSVLINPQTGHPFTNSDGSIYHFDPENPPKLEGENNTCSQQPPKPAPSGTFTSPSVTSAFMSPVLAERQSTLLPLATATASATPLMPGVLDTNTAVVLNRPPLAPPLSLEYRPEMTITNQEQSVEHPLYHQAAQPHLMVPNHTFPGPINTFPGSSNTYSSPNNIYTGPTSGFSGLEATVYPPMPSNTVYISQYGPPPPPPPPPPSNHNMYNRPPAVEAGSHDLYNYLRGLKLGEVGRTDRHMFCCPPAHAPPPTPVHPAGNLQNHYTQAPTVPIQMYYPGLSGGQQNQMGHGRYPFSHYHAPGERVGNDYQQQPSLVFLNSSNPPHNHNPPSNSVGVPTGPSYCPTSNNMVGMVQLPQPPSCQSFHHHMHTTPPNTPQNGPQFAIYNSGGYPIYHPPTRGCPTLQINVVRSPPPVAPPSWAAPPDTRQPASPIHYTTAAPPTHSNFYYPSSDIMYLQRQSAAPRPLLGAHNRAITGAHFSPAFRQPRPILQHSPRPILGRQGETSVLRSQRPILRHSPRPILGRQGETSVLRSQRPILQHSPRPILGRQGETSVLRSQRPRGFGQNNGAVRIAPNQQQLAMAGAAGLSMPPAPGANPSPRN